MPLADTPMPTEPQPDQAVAVEPCPNPWCDEGDPRLTQQSAMHGGYAVWCRECGLHGPSHPTKAEAVAAWNLHPAHLAQPADAELVALAKHTNWELSHFGFEGEDEWQVHSVNGGKNDREWTLIGTGDTPAEAIRDALARKAQP